MTGVDEFHQEVTSKGYKYLRPGVQDEFYGARAMHVTDPFGNRISFNEFKSQKRLTKVLHKTGARQLCRRTFAWVTSGKTGLKFMSARTI